MKDRVYRLHDRAGCTPARRILGARMVAVLAVALTAMTAGAGPVLASSDAFLTARMTVSSPAGANNLCARYGWACSRSAAPRPISGAHLDLAIRMNRQINREVRSISDQGQYGRAEYWALPTSRGGDCEDFALIKKKRLIEAGLDPQMLLISTALDRNRNAHAVLIMRTVQGDFVLDNLRDEVLHWRQTGYTYLRMQDPVNPAGWTAVIDGGILRNDTAVSTPRLVQSGAKSAAPLPRPERTSFQHSR
jgi:predicted transglutaminase-like cysteine proteinase